MSTAPVIALSESVPEAGAVVYWSLAGSPPLAAVRGALQGIVSEDSLPGEPSLSVALHQAACRTFPDCLVRPLSKGGLAIVQEWETQEGSLQHRVLWHVQSQRDYVTPQAGQEQQEHETAAWNLGHAMGEAMATCPAAHLGDWLVRQVKAWGGVGLRDRGSVYFLPPGAMPAFRAVRDALARVSGADYRFSVIPAVRGDEAVQAVLRAVLAEAEQEAASMELDLCEAMGKKAIDNRMARCEQVEAKVASYEKLLEQAMPNIKERLDGLRCQLTLALMKAPKKEGP